MRVKGKESRLSELEIGMMHTFVEGARLLGLPKSVGEIYGLLYLSESALSMEQIVERLQISLGSASQGLRQLKVFKAVKSHYVPGERREYYVAEAELRKLIAGYLREELQPYLQNTQERLESFEPMLPEENTSQSKHIKTRYKALLRWHSKSAKWLQRAQGLIRS